MVVVSPLAKRLIPLLDLTNVDDGCTEADALALCDKALSSPVKPAALCIRPAFVAAVRQCLGGQSKIKVATVINFADALTAPEAVGHCLDADRLARETRMAVVAGADEIDLVFPWLSFLEGEEAKARRVVETVREAAGEACLKVIMESGVYPDLLSLRRACDLVIDAGADFLKTSSTRVLPAATLEATQVFCEASRAVGKLVGIKVSGGIRTPEQAQSFMNVISESMGLNWIEQRHVRIGASKLLDNLLGAPQSATAVGY